MKETKKKPLIIGLTGPIASGKNEVCKILRRRGAYVIEADKVGHEIMKPQRAVWHNIVRTFGSKILMAGGKVNRRKLGELVFGNPKLLKKLNKIMHPVMKEKITKEIRDRKSEIGKLIVINAAVLKEMELISLVDEVWVVLADKKKRLNRLVKKGLSRERALARIRVQKADKDYIKIADKVIRNNGTKKRLKEEILKIMKARF
ncbi:hypothetical protein AMJ44_03920 [candidate division WOR-1 bacterium DG_54_3]|uniref:Dephospho-CoA kinase n=1 Tax=candidate division WOR-1 bacterium DG_54_3 TaxID=1703775 RepID=A0A0S7Y3Q4_UNCSA|nr:MAG: hypothetical protein AMJ44_03920 [candidate division WOR-1 bacterium DG_54_3]